METASIYDAEISGRGKENEDQLTSRVFGALAMLPKDTVLLPFLELLAKDTISWQDKADLSLSRMPWQSQSVKPAKISLWEYTEGNYPDVCIQIADIFVVIEVKKRTPPTKKQIIEQYRTAINKLGKTKRESEFVYFLLTNHEKMPDVVKCAQETLRNKFRFPDAEIHWRRWPQVWKWLCLIEEKQQGLDDTARNLLKATIRLLEEVENMAYPTRFQEEWFGNSVSGNLEKVRELCREVARAIREINTKLKEYQLQTVGNQPHPRILTLKLDDADNWVQDDFCFFYKGTGWQKVKKPYQDPCLYIEFNLRKGEEGVYVGFWWDHPEEKQVESIKKQLDNIKNEVVFDQDYWDNEEKLAVFYEIRLDDLVGTDRILRTLLGKLNCMRELIENIEEFGSDLGLKHIRKQTKRKK